MLLAVGTISAVTHGTGGIGVVGAFGGFGIAAQGDGKSSLRRWLPAVGMNASQCVQSATLKMKNVSDVSELSPRSSLNLLMFRSLLA